MPAFVRAFGGDPAFAPPWMQALRGKALAHFEQVGLPTQKLEDWKFTSFASVGGVAFEPGPLKHGVTRAHVEALANAWDSLGVVFVNGRLTNELCEWRTAEGVQLLSFEDANRQPALEQGLGLGVALDRQPLAALNTALATDGAVIRIEPGARPRPIHVVYVTSSAKPVAAFPRVYIDAAEGSQASIVQAYVGTGGEKSFTDAVVEVRLGPGAALDLYTQQREPANASHAALVQVNQAAQSRFGSYLLSLGAQLARDEVRVRMEGEGSSCTLHGLYLGAGTQHLDQHTVIEHASPRCTSRELYKGVLDEHAHGVFTGRIWVHAGAQKTDSTQTNKNLLLSDHAQVDTRPQLEIFADDVKCTHGSAVGQLDEAALFYLRSRGIPYAQARGLLTSAFVGEVLDALPLEPLRLRTRELVAGKLGRALA